jgi:hypothetical protein
MDALSFNLCFDTTSMAHRDAVRGVSGIHPISKGVRETVFRGQTVTGCPEKLSPLSANPLILRFLPEHFRMLGGEVLRFPSDAAENSRFVSLCAHPQRNKGLTA